MISAKVNTSNVILAYMISPYSLSDRGSAVSFMSSSHLIPGKSSLFIINAIEIKRSARVRGCKPSGAARMNLDATAQQY